MRSWLFHSAKWWQFWFPQSDLIGGAILGVVIVGLLWFIMFVSMAFGANLQLLDGDIAVCKCPVVVTPTPTPPVTPPPVVPPGPPPPGTMLLPWGLNGINAGQNFSFAAGETKIMTLRVSELAKGIEVRYAPQSDFTVTCSFKMPLKTDGTPYHTLLGKTEFTGLSASYEGSVWVRLFTQSLGGIVHEPYIYPGDFIFTCTADKAGRGTMNTGLIK